MPKKCWKYKNHDCIKNPELNSNLEWGLNLNIDKDHFNKIESSDAILILNYPKNNIQGYIGGSSLMEIAVARHLDKKIFILHELPSEDEIRYALEIKVTRPIILNGDISKINNHINLNLTS
ncbi:MAG: hypothetical protein NTX00_04875 [Candidatus Parcubacteria bacterium]|nr:hypothetical protein [Candidatus Parcubacteria bacterium]